MNFFLLFSHSLSAEIPLPLDDSYHNFVLNTNETDEFIVQGMGKEAAVLVVQHKNTKLTIQKKNYGDSKYTDVTVSPTDREKDFVTKTIEHGTSDYFTLKLTCGTGPCQFTMRNVHTAPVYRVSAVLGAFSLFICLFLLVFAWTIFCGACRAERKR